MTIRTGSRNDPPEAEPGDDREEAGEDENGCDHRPHRLPEEDQPRAPDGALDAAAGLRLDAEGNVLRQTVFGFGHAPNRPSPLMPPSEL